MKRTIPLLITAIAGFVLIVAFFIPAFQQAGEDAAIWFDILAAIAFVLGGANLFRLQLQHISDRQPGWGYAAVTLFFFVVTLALGLLKVSCPPEPNVEGYGEATVSFPIQALPQYQLAVTVPLQRADDAPLPKSVQRQLTVTRGADGTEQFVFSGWMQPQQRDDLLAWQDTLEWKCQIERLAEKTQPPPELRGRIRYDASHYQLVFRGMMSQSDRDALLRALPDSAEATSAVDQLYEQSQRESSIEVSDVPAGFVIPEEAREQVQLRDDRLIFRGPMSVPMRNNLALIWRHDPRARPMTDQQKTELLQEISQRGKPLNELQQTVFRNYFASDWTADQLIQILNTAGISEPEPKTSCELLAEIQAGNLNPELTHAPPPPVVLNEAQRQCVQSFTNTPSMTQQELAEQLAAAGEFTAAQQAALTSFFNQLPTRASQYRELCFRLLEVGPLTTAQKDFLLEGAREQFRWRQQIGRLFLAANPVRFPWSGHYSAQGSPFWWLYEYVLQPLLTTTFAVLAFYVASAAFRAFRAKNLEAVLLLGTAFIILLGRTPAGPALTGWIPERFSAFRLDQMTVYIMSIFNTAGNRAIMIGIALGMVSTSLKVLLGIDRSYLGRGDE